METSQACSLSAIAHKEKICTFTGEIVPNTEYLSSQIDLWISSEVTLIDNLYYSEVLARGIFSQLVNRLVINT